MEDTVVSVSIGVAVLCVRVVLLLLLLFLLLLLDPLPLVAVLLAMLGFLSLPFGADTVGGVLPNAPPGARAHVYTVHCARVHV